MLEPTDAEIISSAIDSRLLDLHTSVPGKIVTYDATKQVADVEVMVKHPLEKADGSILQETYAVIPNVKVRWPRGGGWSMHLPLAAGDHVILIFSEASIAQWRETGEVSEVGDLRRHNLGHAFAIPGIAPDDDPIATADAPASGQVVLNGPSGFFRVGAPSADAVAHATSTNAAITALQQQIAALQTEVVALAAAATASAAAFLQIKSSGAPMAEPASPPGPFFLANAANSAVAAVVSTETTAIGTAAAQVTAQESLIPATKLKAE